MSMMRKPKRSTIALGASLTAIAVLAIVAFSLVRGRKITPRRMPLPGPQLRYRCRCQRRRDERLRHGCTTRCWRRRTGSRVAYCDEYDLPCR